jgi:hypothetical protein
MLGLDVAPRAAASLGLDLANAAWKLIKVPGQVAEGSLQPTVASPSDIAMEPGGQNLLSIPDYAKNLAMAGLGVGSVAAPAAAEGILPQFGGWHGTGVPQRFEQFENRFINTGEGNQDWGWGHYIAGAKGTALWYKKTLGEQHGTPGSLLRITAKPDEEDLLDMDLPWHMQTPQVQQGVLNSGLDPDYLSQLDEINPTGRDLHDELSYIHSRGPTAYWNDPEVQALGGDLKGGGQQYVAGKLDAAGVPGVKYKDQLSRYKEGTPSIKHNNDLLDAPDVGMAYNFLENKPIEGDLNSTIGNTVSNLREGTPDHNALADWIEKEHAAGNFGVGDGLTRNYVIFNGNNLNIDTWDGFPVK